MSLKMKVITNRIADYMGLESAASRRKVRARKKPICEVNVLVGKLETVVIGELETTASRRKVMGGKTSGRNGEIQLYLLGSYKPPLC